MNSRLESLLSAYRCKPKKLLTHKKPKQDKASLIKQSNSGGAIKIHQKLPKIDHTLKQLRVTRKKYSSVAPSTRSSSELAYNFNNHLIHNASFDDCLMKLENITIRNSNARLDLVSIQKKIIEVGVNRKLRVIAETDEGITEQNLALNTSINAMLRKIEDRKGKKINERMKSLDNLLVY